MKLSIQDHFVFPSRPLYQKLSKFGIWVAGWVLTIKSKDFRDFAKIS